MRMPTCLCLCHLSPHYRYPYTCACALLREKRTYLADDDKAMSVIILYNFFPSLVFSVVMCYGRYAFQ